MKFEKSLVVYKKELLDTLRDRKTLAVMLLMPIVLYPLIFIIMSQMMVSSTKKISDEKSNVVCMQAVPEQLREMLRTDENIILKDSSNPVDELAQKSISAYLEYEMIEGVSHLRIYTDSSDERSVMAGDRIEDIVKKYKRALQEEMLRKAKVDTLLLDIVVTENRNTASPDKMGGKFLGFIIPTMLVISTILGSIYPAIEFTAVEKERGTLETILTVPVSKDELFLGKFLAVCSITVLTAFLNLLSILLVYSFNMAQLSYVSEGANLAVSMSPGTVAVLFVLIIPLACFISAAIMSVCLFAKSFKDAQNISAPVYILFMLPSFVTMVPGVKLDSVLSYVPVVNVCLAYKAVLLQEYSAGALTTVFITNLLFAFMGYILVLRLFNAEEVLFAEGRGFTILMKRSEIVPDKQLQPSDAFILVAVVLMLIVYIGSYIQLKQIYWGLAGTQWGLIFIPVVFAVWYFKLDYRTSLNIRSFKPAVFFGTLLMACGVIFLNVFLSDLQMKILPGVPDEVRQMEKLLDFSNQNIPVFVIIFIIALSPAICEELFFRGLLLSSLKGRLPDAAVITVVAVTFGIYHLSIYKIIPTAIIGAAITYLVIRSGSIFPGMISHFVNNSAAVAFSYKPEWASAVDAYLADGRLSWVIFAGAVLVIAAGAAIVEGSQAISKR